HKLVGDLYDRAEEAGAEAMVVSCQMCQLNVDAYQTEIGTGRGRDYNLPTLYFTELMGLAMGLKKADTWLGRHFVDPRPLLRGYL
ncbi:MAG: disulfide reductase, partial [Deltaproteobacteria bacterium]|nr:disulfide reductase [Deltaproteobacteria bacterium]